MTNQSIAGKRSIRSIMTAVIALVLIVSTFASTAIAGTLGQYEVSVVDNGQSVTVTTTETEPIEILKSAGITLDDDDKLDISSFEESKGGKIIIHRMNSINVESDGKITTYDVYSEKVGDALTEAGVKLNKGDRTTYDFDAPVKDGMVIGIKKAFSVSVTADGKTTKYSVVDGSVKDLLTTAGITLGEDEYTKPKLSQPVKAGMKVKVYRVEYKTVKKTITMKYSTKEQKDSSLAQGKTKTVKAGKDGEAEVTYRVKYVNSKEKSRKEENRTVKSQPVQKVVKVGTKKTANSVKPNGVKSKNGYTVGQVINGRYTHYCACATCNGNSRGITTSGRRIYNGMSNPYYIACNWLPLGSVVEVGGKNYTVVDRGGSGLSRRGRIDIFTPEGHSACYRYGTGSCNITIVRLGW